MPRIIQKSVEDLSSPLILLRKIRDVMASPESPQERLDAIVRVIASEMVCDVCSVYMRRAGDVLELFANVGLNPSSAISRRAPSHSILPTRSIIPNSFFARRPAKKSIMVL